MVGENTKNERAERINANTATLTEQVVIDDIGRQDKKNFLRDSNRRTNILLGKDRFSTLGGANEPNKTNFHYTNTNNNVTRPQS